MADISCNLTLSLLRRLEEEKKMDKYNPKSTTTIIHEALAMYFLRKDIERGIPLTPKDCEQVVPVDELKPLSISGIKSGPGAPQRLAAIGIKSIDVLRARRAKSSGLDYNKDLEKYFDLV